MTATSLLCFSVSVLLGPIFQMAIRTFLSSVTDKAATANRQPDPLRTWLADELRKSGTHSVYQEFLIEIGVNTLVKLAKSIENESDVVLHIVGDEPGSVPPQNVVAELLNHCGEPFNCRHHARTLYGWHPKTTLQTTC